jgi:adenylylsulfate kinase
MRLMKKKNNNTVWHKGYITKRDRSRLNKHDAGVIWFTGLSASGKSTIAHSVEKKLFQKGIRAYVFDGDNVRHGLNSDLGFSGNDREENIRRIVEVTRLFVDAGIVILAAFITPLGKQREFIRKSFSDMKFVEVYVKCDIEECVRRDPKGLYAKARAGIIQNYTGVSSPFEEPANPDIVINTREMGIEDAVNRVLESLQERDFLSFRDS